RRTVVNDHCAAQVIVEVTFVWVDLLTVHASDPPCCVHNPELMNCFLELHADWFVCSYAVCPLGGVSSARGHNGYIHMGLGLSCWFVSHLFAFLIPVTYSGADLYIDSAPEVPYCLTYKTV